MRMSSACRQTGSTTSECTVKKTKLPFKRDPQVEEVINRITRKMRSWGITVTFLAMQLGISRQYAWQITYYRTLISLNKAREVERTVDSIIAQQKHLRTFGDRLRAARISAGLTLKDVASMIGYTWVGIERWEKNVCLPKPGVLWHLRSLYCVDEQWLSASIHDLENARVVVGERSSEPRQRQYAA